MFRDGARHAAWRWLTWRCETRTRRDEMLRAFRGGPYVYDIVMDIGAYRDMHRHRRCIQLRQEYSTNLGYSVPQPAIDGGCDADLRNALDHAFEGAAFWANHQPITYFPLQLAPAFYSRWILLKRSISAACGLA